MDNPKVPKASAQSRRVAGVFFEDRLRHGWRISWDMDVVSVWKEYPWLPAGRQANAVHFPKKSAKRPTNPVPLPQNKPQKPPIQQLPTYLAKFLHYLSIP